MSERSKTRQSVVGYVRVSTEDQESEGGLDRQAGLLREWCLLRNLECVEIYEDTASGVEAANPHRRPGLFDAARSARAISAPIVVTDLTRISRRTKGLEKLLHELGVDFLSISDGGHVDGMTLLKAVSKGEEFAKAIQAGTKQVLQRKKREGKMLGTPNEKLSAAQASARSRKLKSDDVIYEIARVLSEDPSFKSLRVPAIAELLNRRGIRSTRGNEWNAHSARRMIDLAKDLLAEQEQIDTDLDAEEVRQDQGSRGLGGIVSSKRSSAVVEDVISEDEAAEATLRSLPNYGRF